MAQDLRWYKMWRLVGILSLLHLCIAVSPKPCDLTITQDRTGIYDCCCHRDPDSLKGTPAEKTSLVIYLFLQRNDLENLDHEFIAAFPRVVFLHINDNKLTRLESGIFNNCKYLMFLYLQNNLLEFLPGKVFTALRILNILYLSHNRLTSLEPGTFDSLIYLKKLYLSYNHLNVLEPSLFQNLTKLIRLDLSHNNLTVLEPLLQNETQLFLLDLGYNKLSRLRNGVFDSLTALAELRLEWNELFYIGPRVFTQLPNLIKIRFPVLCDCSNISELFPINTNVTIIFVTPDGVHEQKLWQDTIHDCSSELEQWENTMHCNQPENDSISDQRSTEEPGPSTEGISYVVIAGVTVAGVLASILTNLWFSSRTYDTISLIKNREENGQQFVDMFMDVHCVSHEYMDGPSRTETVCTNVPPLSHKEILRPTKPMLYYFV